MEKLNNIEEKDMVNKHQYGHSIIVSDANFAVLIEEHNKLIDNINALSEAVNKLSDTVKVLSDKQPIKLSGLTGPA